jgi:hypothetical protein
LLKKGPVGQKVLVKSTKDVEISGKKGAKSSLKKESSGGRYHEACNMPCFQRKMYQGRER